MTNEVPWYDVLIPAVAAALIIRADARLVGPYWAFSELLPGVGSIYADFGRERSLYRPAVVRRLLYALLPGIYVGIRYDGLSPLDAAIPGAVALLLILWPVVFHGLPVASGVGWLLAMYAALVVLFGSLSALAYEAVEFMERDAGSFTDYLVTKGIEVGIELALIAIAGSVLLVAWRALRRAAPSADWETAAPPDWASVPPDGWEAVPPPEQEGPQDWEMTGPRDGADDEGRR